MDKKERNGIEWKGKKLRPAVFDDKYLAQCEKENKEPDKAIYDHFWKNCVEIQEYTPRFCSKKQQISRYDDKLI